MKQGDVWYVDYDPGFGHEFQKIRPAIIISSDTILKYSNLITVMAITKNSDKRLDDDIRLEKDEKNKLLYDSIIKVLHISSFDKNRFKKQIGIIDDGSFNKIKKYIKKHFSL